MSSDGGLLALIVDDDAAIRALAAWASGRYKLSTAFEPSTLEELSVLADVHHSKIASIMKRLIAAKVILDEEISEWGDKLLQSHVSKTIGAKARR